MIITKTPFRVSFIGGGSDLEDFYKYSQGAVLSTSINKYMYISSHNFFDKDKICVKYSRTEIVENVDSLKHPIVKNILKKFDIGGAIEISSSADVPSGTGLGSSSSFTVGLLHNLYVRNGRYVTKDRLAEEACEIEIEKLKEPIGKQDQYAAAFGGLNIFKFNPNGLVEIDPLHVRRDIYKNLQRHLVMFYIGNQRKASDILKEQKQNVSSAEKIDILKEMVKLVWKARDALYLGDLDMFGDLLHQNWLFKQQLASKISNDDVDLLYEKARGAGARGGKLLGAGGGGFLLIYCEPELQDGLRERFKNFRELNFKFEYEGSKVIYIGDEYEKH